VIGGPKGIDWVLKMAAFMISGEMKTFSSSQRPEARHWIIA
jgi:hypothetical protein